MLNSGTGAITKSQPQVAQLEITYKGPLVKGSVVQNIADLALLPINNHYIGKQVWVISAATSFYLDGSGDGNEISHWKKQASRVIIPLYSPSDTYEAGDSVHLGGKIYKAKVSISQGQDPASNPTLWLTIAGDTYTYRYIFTNTNSVIIYTDIRNPLFEIMIGEMQKDSNDNYVIGPDGMIALINPEIVEAFTRPRFDLAPLNGLAYEIMFEEDLQPIQLSGAVNIK